ncbi:MAG: tRNA-guanine transglycosylase, partial [Negativicutes bacterium]|nr:tRNA-guanine transglycosylase [Negativicutes bacterium]
MSDNRPAVFWQRQTGCRQTRARAGWLHTPHGVFPTPMFMAVGTRASVKTMAPAELHDIGCGVILANTYHLFLRPGPAVIAKMGGLHRFMSWSGGLLTDSGGFQVFSLGKMCRISEDGVLSLIHI